MTTYYSNGRGHKFSVRSVFMLGFLIISTFLFYGCSSPKEESNRKISSPEQLNDPRYKIGGAIGTKALSIAQEKYSKARFVEFNEFPDTIASLEAQKIDAVVYDRPPLEYAAIANDRLVVLPENIGLGHIVIGAPLTKKALIEKVNEYVRQYKADGTATEMYDRWIKSKHREPKEIPEPQNPDGVLNIGFDALNEPMSFIDENHQINGYDVELGKRIALFLNKKIKPCIMEYSALFSALEAEKIDLAVASMDKTPERGKVMLFSDEYIDSPAAMMILTENYFDENKEKSITSIKDLAGKRAASLTGSSFKQLTENYVQNVDYVFYNDSVSSIHALLSGKVEAVLFDEPVAGLMANRFKDTKIACVYAEDHYAFAFRKNSPLCSLASEVIRKMKESGEMKKLIDKWCSSDDSKKVFEKWTHKKDFTGSKGVLRFGADPTMEPMVYVGSDGTPIGFDVELARRIAYDLDMKFEVLAINFGSLIESLVSEKIHFVGGAMSITEERKKQVDFTESYYKGGLTVLARKNSGQGTDSSESNIDKPGFGEKFINSFNRTFLHEQRWKLILYGLKTTVIITVLAAILGTFLAFGVCCARRSKLWFLRLLAKIYISIMQGMPMLVILMVFYYVVFAEIDINAIWVAVIGFGLNFGAYAGEMMRTGMESVDPGLLEAAQALGLRKTTIFRKIVFPLAARRILPVYKGEFINMLKTTSIVGYIAIQDLTKMSDIIRSRTYEAFFPLIATAIIYFVAAHLLASFLTWIEFRLNPHSRRNSMKMREVNQ